MKNKKKKINRKVLDKHIDRLTNKNQIFLGQSLVNIYGKTFKSISIHLLSIFVFTFV